MEQKLVHKTLETVKRESPPWTGHRQLGGAVVGARLGSRPGNKLFTGEPTIFREEMGSKSFIFRTKSSVGDTPPLHLGHKKF